MGGKPKELTTTQKTDQTETSGQTSQITPTIPSFLQPFITQGTGVAGGALGNLQNLGLGNLVAPFSPDQLAAFEGVRGFGAGDPFQSALNALQGTARGDFLFGGPGFQQGVDASVRAAQPHILSTFGAAGRGTGGLAQAAIAQQATDAFARQFGDERSRQFQAASALPGLAMTPLDLLLRTGGMQQAQEQQRIGAPINFQQGLLTSALAGLPLASLLGQTGTLDIASSLKGKQIEKKPLFQNKGGNIFGGALSGLGLGAAMAPAGATGLAALGGPLGIGLGLGGGLLGAFL